MPYKSRKRDVASQNSLEGAELLTLSALWDVKIEVLHTDSHESCIGTQEMTAVHSNLTVSIAAV